ncbi:hypothetical protein KIJ96_16685 [Pseudoalteromonas piscicida]|uniref:hypothetical protein n=1 Tax=Pseudoalteromonas piscicida TaxID=43662 RepID=UPI001D09FC49|nr:hypothetical protein [Pseudoalteromonas piscicida]UDM61401.1 hypothetical protein KIJ96_16685 [Pseudoalteromonas piscicida]
MSLQRLKLLTIGLCLIAFTPLLGLLLAELIAEILHCHVAESASSDCIVAGYDFGMPLAILYTGGWVSMITVPVAGLAALVCYIKYRDAKLNNNQ